MARLKACGAKRSASVDDAPVGDSSAGDEHRLDGALRRAWLRRRSLRLPSDETEPDAQSERGATSHRLLIGALASRRPRRWHDAPRAEPRHACSTTRFPENTYWYAGVEILVSLVSLGAAWKLTLAQDDLVSRDLRDEQPHLPLPAAHGRDRRVGCRRRLDRRAGDRRAALLNLWQRPQILSLWAHFTLASVAVGCTAVIALAGVGASRYARFRNRSRRRSHHATIGGWAMGATVLQIPVGIWLLLASDEAAQQSMMGDNCSPTVGLAGGVWVALGVMQSLSVVRLGRLRPTANLPCVRAARADRAANVDDAGTSRQAGVAPRPAAEHAAGSPS